MVTQSRNALANMRLRVRGGQRAVSQTLRGFGASEEALRKRTAELIKEMRKAKVQINPENMGLISKATLNEMEEEASYGASEGVAGRYTWANAARNTINKLKRENKI